MHQNQFLVKRLKNQARVESFTTRQNIPGDLQNRGIDITPSGRHLRRQLPNEVLSVVQKSRPGSYGDWGVVGTGSGRIAVYPEIIPGQKSASRRLPLISSKPVYG